MYPKVFPSLFSNGSFAFNIANFANNVVVFPLSGLANTSTVSKLLIISLRSSLNDSPSFSNRPSAYKISLSVICIAAILDVT